MVLKTNNRKKMAVLSLGGNIGNVQQVFEAAIKRLQDVIGKIVLSSSLYQTKAWGVENQPDFLNQVIVLETNLLPIEVLKTCLAIEKELGRVRKKKWHKRVIDIDVLFYETQVIDSKMLTLPHPHIQNRNFILYPLVEIIPNFKHPIFNKTLMELKNNCKDKLAVNNILLKI